MDARKSEYALQLFSDLFPNKKKADRKRSILTQYPTEKVHLDYEITGKSRVTNKQVGACSRILRAYNIARKDAPLKERKKDLWTKIEEKQKDYLELLNEGNPELLA